MFLATSLRIIWKALKQWGENMDARLAAGLAYYALFSFAPLLLLAITVTGMVFGEEKARRDVYQQLRLASPDTETADIMKFLLDNASEPQSTWGLVAGMVLLLFGAIGMFLHLRGSLATIWKLEPVGGNSYLGMLFDYLLSVAMVIVTGLLLLATLVASTAARYVEERFPDASIAWGWVEIAGSFVLLVLLFTAIYRVLSGNRIPWGYTVYGSIIAAILFTVGKFLMSYYFYYFSPSSAYGAAGSIMAFLLWIYYSAHILFFGAELIQARRTRHEWMK